MSDTVFIKYPGGKQSELPIIKQYLPKNIERYYEPFVGGGTVFFNISAQSYLINDKSSDLIKLYNATKIQDKVFFETFYAIDSIWNCIGKFAKDNEGVLTKSYIQYRDDIICLNKLEHIMQTLLASHNAELVGCLVAGLKDNDNIFIGVLLKHYVKKMNSMKALEKKKHLPEKDIFKNLEGALKAGVYMYIRNVYNTTIKHPERFEDGAIAAVYAFIRDMSYSSMFRFNRNGEFNVPYGGISYNTKSIAKRIECFKNVETVDKLKNTIVENLDFEAFMKLYPAQKDDFLFIDPPYDSEFSEYDNSGFGRFDQERLADYLINHCEANFMVVIKDTEYIQSLYQEGVLCKNGKLLNVFRFDKKYTVSFMNRNKKDVKHVLITNYPILKEE